MTPKQVGEQLGSLQLQIEHLSGVLQEGIAFQHNVATNLAQAQEQIRSTALDLDSMLQSHARYLGDVQSGLKNVQTEIAGAGMVLATDSAKRWIHVGALEADLFHCLRHASPCPICALAPAQQQWKFLTHDDERRTWSSYCPQCRQVLETIWRAADMGQSGWQSSRTEYAPLPRAVASYLAEAKSCPSCSLAAQWLTWTHSISRHDCQQATVDVSGWSTFCSHCGTAVEDFLEDVP